MIAELKPYPEYKESYIPWSPELPATWGTERAKRLFTKMQREVRPEDEVVTCFRDGMVTLRKNRRLRGFTEATAFSGYQGIRKGDLVIHGMDAFAGAIGVSDSDGKGTPVYNVCKPGPGVVAGYYAHTLREMSRSQWILALAKGIRERSTDFRYEMFGNQIVPLPPPAEQAAIVRFLDHWNRHLEKVIRTKRKQFTLISEMLMSVTQEAMATSKKKVRIWSGVEIMSRPVDRSSRPAFVRVGLYNRGRGIFQKPASPGDELGDSDFYWIEEGDLVISGQFAWEGSVALVRSSESGCIASHRYPVMRGRADVVSSAALLAILRSSYGAMILNENSRGAAGRNRPLNFRSLLKEQIPIPTMVDQKRIADLLEQEHGVSQSLMRLTRFINEYRTRLTADVVTGKLDVRAAAAQLPEEAEDEPMADSEIPEEDSELEEVEP
jgi:type I restriction enzyme S subunit